MKNSKVSNISKALALDEVQWSGTSPEEKLDFEHRYGETSMISEETFSAIRFSISNRWGGLLEASEAETLDKAMGETVKDFNSLPTHRRSFLILLTYRLTLKAVELADLVDPPLHNPT